jgi:hypothetical protein
MFEIAWLAGFLGAGFVGYLLKLKGPQAWSVFLVAWFLLGVLIYRLTGIQTHLGYYIGIEKDPKYPELTV